MTNNFTFWCPIEKSQEIIDPTTGEQVMRLGGIASTADEDSDGESLDPNGFDIKPLMKSGMVNWHHQAKGMPSTIIGEPSKAEIRKDGLYIETDLYPNSKVACEVWELAKTLEKNSKTRRLGYSIEGKVLKRKSDDKNSPDYKKIEKAVITGVAITHMPKNPKTFANIIKGEIDDDYDEEYEENKEEKSVNTETAAPLKKESVDKKVKNQEFAKARVMERLFNDIPGISIGKANKIYGLILNISKMSKNVTITDDDITKAYEALGLDIEKGCGSADGGETKEEEVTKSDEETEEKKTTKETEKKTDETKETSETEETEEEEEEEEKGVKKGGENRFDRIEKAIATSHQINGKYMKALGVMVKDLSQKAELLKADNDELRELIKAQDDTISEMSQRIEAFGNATPVPKSISHAKIVERQFDKGNLDELGGKREERKPNQFSMSTQKAAIVELLDQATFAKGYDEEMSKACLAFESSNVMPQSIIARLKNEYGVEIIK